MKEIHVKNSKLYFKNNINMNYLPTLPLHTFECTHPTRSESRFSVGIQREADNERRSCWQERAQDLLAGHLAQAHGICRHGRRVRIDWAPPRRRYQARGVWRLRGTATRPAPPLQSARAYGVPRNASRQRTDPTAPLPLCLGLYRVDPPRSRRDWPAGAAAAGAGQGLRH